MVREGSKLLRHRRSNVNRFLAMNAPPLNPGGTGLQMVQVYGVEWAGPAVMKLCIRQGVSSVLGVERYAQNVR